MQDFLSLLNLLNLKTGFAICSLVICISSYVQVQAQVQPVLSAQAKDVVSQQKAYPGGRDEDDLKVQEELKPTSQTVDRRSIELRILKTHFKKTDAELIGPSKTEQQEQEQQQELE